MVLLVGINEAINPQMNALAVFCYYVVGIAVVGSRQL
jgi:hypothetical protein